MQADTHCAYLILPTPSKESKEAQQQGGVYTSSSSVSDTSSPRALFISLTFLAFFFSARLSTFLGALILTSAQTQLVCQPAGQGRSESRVALVP